MKISEFDFDLPQELIAQRPAVPRDSSRLLDAQNQLVNRKFYELPDLLKSGDLIVFNNTKVIPALLSGNRERELAGEVSSLSGKIKVTLHKQKDGASWYSFVRPSKKLKKGDRIIFGEEFWAKVEKKLDRGEVLLSFNIDGAGFKNNLRRYGSVPLPPYIKRSKVSDENDSSDYQTYFAKKDGAVASPTAGLHFTEKLLGKIKKRDVTMVPVTLHVGGGTFLPVTSENIEDHKMHAEYGEISVKSAEIINKARRRGSRIISIGTTSLRLLESSVSADGVVAPFVGETNIFITPGFRFRAGDLLITNFHLPRSTLMMLVSAFAGSQKIKNVYHHAILHRYRFYSYGDAMFLARGKGSNN